MPWLSVAVVFTLCVVAAPRPATGTEVAVEEKTPLPTVAERTGRLTARPGLLDLYVEPKTGRVLMAVPPPGDRGIIGSYLYIEGLVAGLGSNPVGLDRSQLGPTRVVELRRLGNRVLVEVQTVTPDPSSITVIQHHSLVRLPDDGYRPRPFDPREGSFGIEFADFAAPLTAPLETHWIARHRLEKVDPAAATSPVVEPIVYYLDRGVPEPIRSALLDGALDVSRAYGAGVGAWDRHAIRYAYAQFAPGADEAAELERIVRAGLDEGLIFLSDGDARPPGAANPLANLWDNGADPVAEVARVMEVRRIALARFGAASLAPGRPFADLGEVLAPLYFYHRYQLTAAAKTLGGLNYRHSLRGDGQPTSSPVPAEDQRAALAAILTALEPSALVDRAFIAPGGEAPRLAEIRDAVQWVVADGLVGLAVDPSAAPAVRAHAEAALRDLSTRTAETDSRVGAHRQALHHAVVRFLEDRDWTPAQLPSPLPAPPGDPIGSACAMSSWND
jgi:hypothetical protein